MKDQLTPDQKMRMQMFEYSAPWLFNYCKKLNPRLEFEFKPEHGLTLLERKFDAPKSKAYWIKSYLKSRTFSDSDVADIEDREREVLLQVANLKAQMSHVATFREIKNSTNLPNMRVVTTDYGLTLLDWLCLTTGRIDKDVEPKISAHPWKDPKTKLAMVRAIVQALYEMHSVEPLGFLHCDLKLDNICAALETSLELDAPGTVRGCINLDTLTLIDLGFALRPKKENRFLWCSKNSNIYPHNPASAPPYVSPRFLSAAKLAANGDLSHFQNLDWRIDFFSLAALVESFEACLPQPQNPGTKDADQNYWLALPQRLRDWHDLSDSQTKALPKLPHLQLIQEINELIGLGGHTKVHFELDLNTLCEHDRHCVVAAKHVLGFDTSDHPVPPIDSVRRPPKKSLWPLLVSWRKIGQFVALPLAAAALTYGSYTAWQDGKLAWLLPTKPAVQRLLEAFPQHPGAVAKASLYAGTADKPQTQFLVGDQFRFTVFNSEYRDGYLTVFAADSEDKKAQRLVVVRNNQPIKSMGTVTCPGKATCDDGFNDVSPVTGPVGTVRMLAVITSVPITWPLAPGQHGKPNHITVSSYTNAQDISALFNCASQTGQAAQACQDARQNFAVSPVVTYEVVEAAKPKAATVLPVLSITAQAPASAQPAPVTSPKPVTMIDGYEILDDPVLGKGSLARDPKTGLVWQRCSVGETWNGRSCAGVAERFTFTGAKQEEGRGWRLPTIRELHTLIYCSTGKVEGFTIDPLDGGNKFRTGCSTEAIFPRINRAIFPISQSVNFWSSSPNIKVPTWAWYVNFGWGYADQEGPLSYDFAVRLVRASQ